MSDYIIQNGRLVNMDDLMHSATYVGNSSGGEYLQHWKYIKREKKNGKWVYYYDKDALKKDAAKAKLNVKKSVNKALGYDKKTAYEEAKMNRKKAESRYLLYLRAKEESRKSTAKARAEYDMISDGVIPAQITGSVSKAKEAARQKLIVETDKNTNIGIGKSRAARKVKEADSKEYIAFEKYKKTPAYKIEQLKVSVESGKEKVKDIISGVTDGTLDRLYEKHLEKKKKK